MWPKMTFFEKNSLGQTNNLATVDSKSKKKLNMPVTSIFPHDYVIVWLSKVLNIDLHHILSTNCLQLLFALLLYLLPQITILFFFLTFVSMSPWHFLISIVNFWLFVLDIFIETRFNDFSRLSSLPKMLLSTCVIAPYVILPCPHMNNVIFWTMSQREKNSKIWSVLIFCWGEE